MYQSIGKSFIPICLSLSLQIKVGEFLQLYSTHLTRSNHLATILQPNLQPSCNHLATNLQPNLRLNGNIMGKDWKHKILLGWRELAWKALPRHSTRADSTNCTYLLEKVKPSRLLLSYMHYRTHPRHYRSEYVRGYLHRKRCVQPSRLVIATIPHEISIDHRKYLHYGVYRKSYNCPASTCSTTRSVRRSTPLGS